MQPTSLPTLSRAASALTSKQARAKTPAAAAAAVTAANSSAGKMSASSNRKTSLGVLPSTSASLSSSGRASYQKVQHERVSTSGKKSHLAPNPSNSDDDSGTGAVDRLTPPIGCITENLPPYVNRDGPRPAVFVARLFLSDFIRMVEKKVEFVLSDERRLARQETNKSSDSKEKGHHSSHTSQKKSPPASSIFESFNRDRDPNYNKVLVALASISEFCLPSLVRHLVDWHNHQLDLDPPDRNSSPASETHLGNDANTGRPNPQDSDSLALTSADATNQDNNNLTSEHDAPDFGSPSVTCDNSLLSFLSTSAPSTAVHPSYNTDTLNSQSSLTLRSPTPTLSESATHQFQPYISHTLPLDCQSPSAPVLLSCTNSSIDKPVSGATSNVSSKPADHSVTNEQNSANTSANTTSTSTATTASAKDVPSTSNPPDSKVNTSSLSSNKDSHADLKQLELMKTRKLLIEYAFCQAITEILSQLYLHPGYDDLVGQVETMTFGKFRYSETDSANSSSSSSADQSTVSASPLLSLWGLGGSTQDSEELFVLDKYAEVVGLLAQTRFRSFKKRFMGELNALKQLEPTSHNVNCIITLLAGMKFFRVRMAPIEDFEESFQFLIELAEYFLEVRHKSVRHALANLLVHILMPLAVSVKNEVKIPCLKNFVDLLWTPTLEMCNRKKHSMATFPLVTCLLCLSQRSFFLANWTSFLNMCLSNIKNREPKLCQIALESLYRLIWMYIIRVKCESNNITQARLSFIMDTVFPRGSRSTMPRDAPLNLFVEMIQFIAQERLDFAIRHIIFDLLSLDRPYKVVPAPERMNIAIQAFLVIADSLQQKEGEPQMCKSVFAGQQLHAYAIKQRISSRRKCNNKTLSEEVAKSIGLNPYLSPVLKALNDILKALDSQIGKPFLLNTSQNASKHRDELINGERRPRLDLFKTCIASIPRLMPEGMSRVDLVDLLARLTIHVDEEMRLLAFEALELLVSDFADWRLDTIEGYVGFLSVIDDTPNRHLLDNALSYLLQLLITWRQLVTNPESRPTNSASPSASNGDFTVQVTIQTGYESISSRSAGSGCGSAGGQVAARKNRALAEMRLIQGELASVAFDKLVAVLQKVEAAALVMICSCHLPARRLASHLLRESRTIIRCYSSWICIEQSGFRIPPGGSILDDNFSDFFAYGGVDEDSCAGLRGSLSADNLSRVTVTSGGGQHLISGPFGAGHSSITSINHASALPTSVSKTSITASQQSRYQGLAQHRAQQTRGAHDPYDSDLENSLVDCLSEDMQNTMMLFWLALNMLESEREREYQLALRLLKRVVSHLPFENPEFIEQIDNQRAQMDWSSFVGIHSLIIRGATKAKTYDVAVMLLDQLTPLLRQPICHGLATNSEMITSCIFPRHVIFLLTHLLANYDNPTPNCVNIARRLALWCQENAPQKLDNLATVMNLYSRRSFSKDAFQWTKCIVKYLYDAYSHVLAETLPLLVGLLADGPMQVRPLIAPILYCILNYVDISGATTSETELNSTLCQLYSLYLAACDYCSGDISLPWRDAVQVFKLIVSRSSQLTSNKSRRRELPGRTLDFQLDVAMTPIICRTQLLAKDEHREITTESLTPNEANFDAVSPGNVGEKLTEPIAEEIAAEKSISSEMPASASDVHCGALGDENGDDSNVSRANSAASNRASDGPGDEKCGALNCSWLAQPHVRRRLASAFLATAAPQPTASNTNGGNTNGCGSEMLQM